MENNHVEINDKFYVRLNGLTVKYPKEKGMHHLFEEQAARTPDNIAVIYKDTVLTYNELNKKANKVAWYLYKRGIQESTVIAIFADKCPDLIIGILAVLKVGATYLPIDSNYPDERIHYMLEDSKAHILLMKDRGVEKDCLKSFSVLYLDELLNEYSLSDKNLDLTYHPERSIYVIYTSGSTGNPKGVIINSFAFTNLLYWFVKEFEITGNDTVLLLASVSFDLAQKNIFCTLIMGGVICLYPQETYSSRLISDLIEKHGITLLNCTPSAFSPLIDYNMNDSFIKLKSLRYLFLGGEPIHLDRIRLWANSENYFCKIVNTYGPTECTDIASFYIICNDRINHLTTVPIGMPIYNTDLYVIYEQDESVYGDGMGELYIGGAGVGVGYLDSPELTSLRFVNIPDISIGKLYKTGDIVKLLPDGNIEFLGRLDNQIKIGGHRIELGEIENALLKHKSIRQAVVTAYKGKVNTHYLCAYFVSDEELLPVCLREYLSSVLPDYMIPTYFISLEDIPQTPNGKIDRAALPDPGLLLNAEEQPNKAEQQAESGIFDVGFKIREIIRDNLDIPVSIERIGEDSNLADLGINSITFIKIVVTLEREFDFEFGGEDLNYEKFSSVRSLASYIVSQKMN